MTQPDPVDELLSSIPPRKVAMDSYPELVAAMVRFLDLKAAGDLRVAKVSFTWFYDEKLRPLYNGPARECARTYVRTVLRRDLKTGKPL